MKRPKVIFVKNLTNVGRSPLEPYRAQTRAIISDWVGWVGGPWFWLNNHGSRERTKTGHLFGSTKGSLGVVVVVVVVVIVVVVVVVFVAVFFY